MYRYIKDGLLRVKPIDLPKMVSIRKRSKVTPKATKKILGKSIEKRPECINDRSEFGHWEIDLMLGKKTKGEAVVMTLVECQTRFAITVKWLINKQKPSIGLLRAYYHSTLFALSHRTMAQSSVACQT